MIPIAGGQYRPLDDKSIKKIHESALTLLNEVGVEVNNGLAFEIFQKNGARCDREKKNVKLQRALVEDCIARAPSQVILCGREEKYDLVCSGKNVYVGTGGTALNVIDLETDENRLSQLKDVREIARLCDALDNIHFFLIPVYPNELPIDKVDVNRFYASILNTSKHIMGGVYTDKGTRNVIRMAEEIAGGPQKLRERPFLSFITCIMSPLKIDDLYGELLIRVADSGLPLAIPAEPLTGATAPVTLAGVLAGVHAETLFGVALSQLVNPGTPVLYGCVASSTDLRTMAYITGSIEMGLINAGAAQMAQYVNLPNYTTAGMSDSKCVDVQNGYEKAMTTLAVALAGSNYIHDSAGLVESAMTASYKQYVIDNEINGMVMRAVKGIEVNDETIGLEAYKRVGAGGNFLTDNHTIQWMRKEHYIPTLSDRQLRENWEKDGRRKTAEERGIATAKKILEEHKPLRLPEEMQQRLKELFPEIED